jgi:hypothetical protein
MADSLLASHGSRASAAAAWAVLPLAIAAVAALHVAIAQDSAAGTDKMRQHGFEIFRVSAAAISETLQPLEQLHKWLLPAA